jgi:glucoamylase
VHVVDLPTAALAPGAIVPFTFYWPGADRWEGTDFAVAVVAAEEGGREEEGWAPRAA